MSLNPAGADPAPVTCPSPCPCGCVSRPRRYPTDLTDAQWAVLAPLLPPPACHSRRGGRPEKHCRRQIINALFYLVDNGIKWRAMPADFPPWRTVYGLFTRWSNNLTTFTLVDQLRGSLRTMLGRNRQPSAGIIDAQSVPRSAEGVLPTTSSGLDGHKRIRGRKRHILVDTEGLLCTVIVTTAAVHDNTATPALLHTAADCGIRHVWADQAYHVHRTITAAKHLLDITLDIVFRNDEPGFHVLPRRWVVERTLAWITRRRRCARDYERHPHHHEAMVCWAAILQMTRRHTCPPLPQTPTHD
jgi:transposase